MSEGPTLLGEGLEDWLKNLGANPLLTTGIPALDEAIGGGMCPGQSTVVGGSDESAIRAFAQRIGQDCHVVPDPVDRWQLIKLHKYALDREVPVVMICRLSPDEVDEDTIADEHETMMGSCSNFAILKGDHVVLLKARHGPGLPRGASIAVS